MNDQNPYSTPDAALAMDQDATYEPSIFSFSGRIGRLRYLAYGVGVQFLLMLILVPVGGLSMFSPEEQMSIIGFVGIGVFYIAAIVFSVMFAKRRLNDLNRSGWWFLLFIIPIVNLLVAIYLVFFPGTKGSNDFGPAPMANSIGIKIIGMIFPIIFLLGIIAAIAIPAYQDYVTKAQQSQHQQ